VRHTPGDGRGGVVPSIVARTHRKAVHGALLAAALVTLPPQYDRLLAQTGDAPRAPSSTAGAWTIAGVGAARGEYEVGLDSVHPLRGRRSLRIRGVAARPSGPLVVLQQIRADRFVGQRIRLSGVLHPSTITGVGGYIGVIVADSTGRNVQVSTDSAAVTGDLIFRTAQVELDVPANAVGLTLFVALDGSGLLHADDLTLAVVGRASPAPPRSGAAAAPLADWSRRPTEPRDLDFEAGAPWAGAARSPLEEGAHSK
jgi:hypothetical protein